MDAQTISAFAASAAAVAAGAVAGIQLYVGHRQSKAALVAARAAAINAENAGRHTVAEFRQKWIDNVIETLSRYHALIVKSSQQTISPEESMEVMTLRTKLELLLNPNETATIALLEVMDAIPSLSDSVQRQVKNDELLEVARSLLKAEWVRIKGELK